MTTNLATEASSRSSADSSLSSRIGVEETAARAEEGVITSAIVAEAALRTAGDLSLTTSLASHEVVLSAADTLLESDISTEKAKLDAILLASSQDKDSFAEIVSLINAVDVENSGELAADIATLTASISSETVRAGAAEVAVAANLSTELVDRAAAIASLETNLSDQLATQSADLLSLETRENNRHNKISFADVSSLVVDGSSFPAGFNLASDGSDPRGGFIQLFETDGSNLVSFIAPMEIDMTSGDVTFTFEGNKSGIAVFYSFADDEGTVTV